MSRRLAVVLSALLVAAVPLVLVGNTLLLFVNPWFVHAQYAIPGFPDDDLGLSDDERADLAVTGVRSIRPGSDGVELLREARLPDGAPAFQDREVQHMDDVRSLVRGTLIAWAVALALGAAAALGLWRIGGAPPFRLPAGGGSGRIGKALVAGAYLTLAAMALAALVMLIDFDAFFAGFHGLFFEGDSWRFEDEDTLLQLYPELFWGVAGAAMALLVVLQAGAIAFLVKRYSSERPAAAAEWKSATTL